MITPNIHWVDLLIVAVTIVLALYMGLRFSKRQTSTNAYYAAGGKMPSWAIGMSMFATIISSVTFLAYPAAAYSGNWILLVQGLMVPLVMLGTIGVIVPLYRRVIKLSTYEYFERRFGVFARIYASLAFILEHFSRMGTILYLLGLALGAFIGIDIRLIVIIIGIAVIFLTLLGGMEAVIWMDVIQGFLLILGGLFAVAIIISHTTGGVETLLTVSSEYKKIDFGPYDWDLTQLTFLVMVLNGLFFGIQKYGTDQSIVQRYLAAKSDKAAKKAAWMGIGLSVPAWTLFMLVGTCLFVYYHINPSLLPNGIKSEEVFPWFIASEMPIGICGLVIAALAAGAISSIDSDINSISAIIVEDYYNRFKHGVTDQQRLQTGRWAVIIVGVLGVMIALLYVHWGGEGVLGMLFGLYAIVSAGIVGIFLLGLFSRRACWQGLYIGIGAAVLFTAYAVLTSTHAPDSEQLLLDLGSWNFTHHQYMLGVYSHLIVLIVGYLASLPFHTPLAPKELTWWGANHKK